MDASLSGVASKTPTLKRRCITLFLPRVERVADDLARRPPARAARLGAARRRRRRRRDESDLVRPEPDRRVVRPVVEHVARPPAPVQSQPAPLHRRTDAAANLAGHATKQPRHGPARQRHHAAEPRRDEAHREVPPTAGQDTLPGRKTMLTPTG